MSSSSVQPVPQTASILSETVDGYEISTTAASPSKLKKKLSSFQARMADDKSGAVDIKSKYFPAYAAGVPLQEGKVFAVTGCTTGTGYQLARTLIEKKALVLCLNRLSGRSLLAFNKLTDLAEQSGAPAPVDIPCDLTKFSSVHEAGKALQARCSGSGLDVLVNNAGIMAFCDDATEDGADIQMQTNHLSHFLLTSYAMPLLETASGLRGEARIVNHSSCARAIKTTGGWTNELKAEYFGKNGGNLGGNATGKIMEGPNYERYQQTKLANCVFTYALKDRLEAKGSKIKALVAHPGVAPTSLMLNTAVGSEDYLMVKMPDCLASMMLKYLMHSMEDGTMGILMCSCEPEVVQGGFYGPLGRGLVGGAVHDQKAYKGKAELLPEETQAHAAARKMLWEESEKTCGITFTI